MRPIWKGHISFGLVMIPVNLYPAESPQSSLDLDMLDPDDQSRIRYLRVNEKTGKEVPWKSIVKGYEYEDGKYVIVDEADFKDAASRVTKGVELLDCVPAEQITPLMFEKPYFLEPGKGGEKGYVLLREALKRAGRVGIAQTVLQTRPHLAAVMPHGDLLTLVTMRYPEQMREPTELNIPGGKSAAAKPHSREIELAEKLIEGMASDFNPTKYHDEYRAALDKVIKEKIAAAQGGKKRKPAPVEADDEPPPTYNMMELLRKSLEGRKPKRAGTSVPPSRGTRAAGKGKRSVGVHAERRRSAG